jgi:hypothetical protein
LDRTTVLGGVGVGVLDVVVGVELVIVGIIDAGWLADAAWTPSAAALCACSNWPGTGSIDRIFMPCQFWVGPKNWGDAPDGAASHPPIPVAATPSVKAPRHIVPLI